MKGKIRIKILVLALFFSGGFLKGQDSTNVIKSFNSYDLFKVKRVEYSGSRLDSLLNDSSMVKFIFTGAGHKVAKNVFNGMRISGGTNSIKLKKELLDEVTFLPIWKSDYDAKVYGASISFLQLPFHVDISANYGEIDITEIDREFPFPPGNPLSEEGFPKLKLLNIGWSFEYVPFMISFVPGSFFGIRNPTLYLVPSFGVEQDYYNFKFKEEKWDFYNTSVTAGISLRYKLLFMKFSYVKALDIKEKFDNQIKFNAGFWFSLTK